MTVLSLADPAFLTDPYTATAAFQDRHAVGRATHLDGSMIWVAARDAEVRTVLSDPRFVVDPASVPGGRAPDTRRNAMRAIGMDDELVGYLTEAMLDKDPPHHTRLRKLVSRAFTVRRVTEIRPRVEQICEKLLGALPERAEYGTVDLIEHFAYPLPIAVICELVGVPEEDHQRWLGWSHDLMSGQPDGMRSALRGMAAHVRDLIARHRAEPSGTLLDALIHARETDGDRLTETELITMVLSLVVAGHETTAHLIANGTVTLLTHPEQLALLRGDPALLPAAVHEFQRWCGPIVHGRLRYATEDLTLGEARVRAGEPVMALLVGANRDERRYPRANEFDLTRRLTGGAEQHVGFGAGPHYCLGAALARQESEVAFGALLARFPELALAIPGSELEWLPRPGFRRLARLPVRI